MNTERELEHYIIKQNHLLWRLRFADTHNKDLNNLLINKLTDPRQCECGRLLYGSHFFSLNANIAGMDELEQEHEKIHSIARKIIEGDEPERNTNELNAASKKFLAMLDTIYSEIEAEEERKRLGRVG